MGSPLYLNIDILPNEFNYNLNIIHVTQQNKNYSFPISFAQPFASGIFNIIISSVNYQILNYINSSLFQEVWLNHLHPISPMRLFSELSLNYINITCSNLSN